MENGRIMVSSNCVVCGSEKSRFIKEQEAKGFNLLGKILFPPLALPELIHKNTHLH